MTLFPGEASSEIIDKTPDIGLDGSFACGLYTTYANDTEYVPYDCYLYVDFCSTVAWDNKVTKKYYVNKYGILAEESAKCPRDTFIVGLNHFDEVGFAIKCKGINSNEIITVNPRGYNNQQSSTGWVGPLYKYMTRLYPIKLIHSEGYDEEVYIEARVKFSDYDVNTIGYSNISPGPWGTWLESKDAKRGYYACGMALRVQDDLGNDEDDTTVNAVYMYYCQLGEWDYGYGEYLNYGFDGNWKSDVMCPENKFINYVKIKSVIPKGPGEGDKFDDVALNGIMISCRDEQNPNDYEVLKLEYNSEGDFKDQLWIGFDDKVICGGQVRMDLSTGNDRTGVSGISFKFCPLT
jgi:hypothetical protein